MCGVGCTKTEVTFYAALVKSTGDRSSFTVPNVPHEKVHSSIWVDPD